MLEIKNKNLTVTVDPHGAQLTHVINNDTGHEYIWNNEAWPKHAPILFPAIGRSTNDEYLINGNKYPMQQHGFVSDCDFEVINHEDTELLLSFKGNEMTFKSYPYFFDLRVRFTLNLNQLKVNFEVQNLSDESLSYSLGFHPAFNVDGKFKDYRLSIEPNYPKLQKFEIVKNPFPYLSGAVKKLNITGSSFALDHQMFDEGLVILTEKINHVILKGNSCAVEMDLSDFSHLCLWTKEDEELPFICLEPFFGLPDRINERQELAKKIGNDKLAVGEMKEYQCKLTFE
ncbi:LacX protein plasmid [Lactococcus lactis subsp. lactis]|uniref:aldose 1-epimerase family protein n=1 Tax=Lactococcus lactis TaxID=1358 RepID=UPI00071DB6CD|nr:aldose 1-epimerase family protein [Lactococcus lactis]KST92901.1 LacX protein plasmid [Lactococcus lactis subsp. lactis]